MGLSGSACYRREDCRQQIVRLMRLGSGADVEGDNKN